MFHLQFVQAENFFGCEVIRKYLSQGKQAVAVSDCASVMLLVI